MYMRMKLPFALLTCLIASTLATAQNPPAPKPKPPRSSVQQPARPSTAKPPAQQQDIFKTLQERFDRAQSFEQQGDLIRAESEYRYILGVSLERLGGIYDRLGNLDKAISTFRAATAARVNSADAFLGLGRACLRNGDYEQGIQYMRNLLDVEAENGAARAVLGKLYLAVGKPDPAVVNLEEAHRLLPDDTDTTLAIARARLEQKRPDKAADVFAELIRTYGDSARLHIIFGLAYRQNEYYEKALEELHRAVAIDADYPGAHYYLGLAIVSQEGPRDTEAAVHEFQEELKRRPDDYLANYMLGLVYLQERRNEDALPHLQRAVKINSDRPDALMYLGQALYLTGQQDKAMPFLERAIELTTDPSRSHYSIAKAHYWIGQYLSRQGKTEESQKHLSLAAQYNLKATQATKDQLARYMGGMGGVDEVKRVAETTEEHKPEAVPSAPLAPGEKERLLKAEQAFADVVSNAYNRFGLLKTKQQDFGRAAELLEQAAAWKPDLPEVHFNIGLAHFKAANYPAAAAALEKARERQPDRPGLGYLTGLSYFFAEQYAKAGPLLTNAALEGNDKDPQLMYALGLCHAYAGNRDLGKKILTALLEKEPASSDAHMAMGRALALDGDFKGSIVEFDKALELDPNVPDAHYYKGLALIRLSNGAEGAEEFRAELKRNPRHARAAFHLGYCLSGMDRLDDALVAFQTAIDLDPAYANAYYESGKILVRQGKLDPAVDALQKAVKLGAENSFVYYQLAQAYQRSGKAEQAQAALARYRDLKAKEQAKRPPIRMIEPEQK